MITVGMLINYLQATCTPSTTVVLAERDADGSAEVIALDAVLAEILQDPDAYTE